jgi:hypothetical protein
MIILSLSYYKQTELSSPRQTYYFSTSPDEDTAQWNALKDNNAAEMQRAYGTSRTRLITVCL